MIGSRLARELAARGHAVRALALPGDPAADRLGGTCRVVHGDLTRPRDLAPALEGVHTVYHLAAALLAEDPGLFTRVNVEGTRNLVQAAAVAGVRHFVHVSSASVVYPHTTPYSRSKRAGEAIVRAEPRFEHTIARPTLVFERGGGLEFRLFVDHVCRYPVVLLPGDGSARKSPVHADDLIQGLAAMVGNPVTFGRTYNLCGGETVTIRDLARLVLAHEGKRKPTVTLPAGLCRLAAAVVGRVTGRELLAGHTLAGLTQDADLDPSTAREDLGYRPRGVQESLREFFEGG